MYSESISNTLYTKVKLKKFPLGKTNTTKMPSFFFRELQLITVLLLISDSYMS